MYQMHKYFKQNAEQKSQFSGTGKRRFISQIETFAKNKTSFLKKMKREYHQFKPIAGYSFLVCSNSETPLTTSAILTNIILYYIFIIPQLWLTSHPRSTVVLMDKGNPATSRETYSEDANGDTPTRNPSVINRVLQPLSH